MRAWAYLNIADPLIAWLVYRGELFSSTDPSNPGALSVFAAARLRVASEGGRGGQTLSTELAIEERRQSFFPRVASRLTGFYAFPTEEDARRAGIEWGLSAFKSENLSELSIPDSSTASLLDSDWITQDFGRGVGPWIARYLAGEARSGLPLHELIVEGTALVLNTPLRERAGSVVQETWSEIEGPLELGRIALLLGSPLGRISATLLARSNGGADVVHLLNFPAEDPDFLGRLQEALADPNFPRNGTALQAMHERGSFRVPDLSSRDFTIAPA